MIVEGNLKYVQSSNAPPELYDSIEDPAETDNLAAANSEMVRRFANLVAAWKQTANAPSPSGGGRTSFPPRSEGRSRPWGTFSSQWTIGGRSRAEDAPRAGRARGTPALTSIGAAPSQPSPGVRAYIEPRGPRGENMACRFQRSISIP